MTHIKECWNALAQCKSLPEAQSQIEEFPNKFGDWFIEGKPEGGYSVTNSFWYDDDEYLETEDFDWADIVFERDDLIEDSFPYIKIDNTVFDLFVPDCLINILFSDDDNEKIYRYQMIKEDENGIVMKFIEEF